MRHCDHPHDAGNLSIDDAVGKSTKKIAPCAVQIKRPPLRSAENEIHGMVQLRHKGVTRGRVMFRVPLAGRAGFGNCVRMELKLGSTHSIAPGFGVGPLTRGLP